MYRLYEVTKTTEKETQRIIEYQSLTGAIADYEVNLGNALKADEPAHLFLLLDNIGKVVSTKDKTYFDFLGEEEISPRLIDTLKTGTGEEYEEKANMAKYDELIDVHANYHLKLGRAMKNVDTREIWLYGMDKKGNRIEYGQWVNTDDSVEEPVEEEQSEE